MCHRRHRGKLHSFTWKIDGNMQKSTSPCFEFFITIHIGFYGKVEKKITASNQQEMEAQMNTAYEILTACQRLVGGLMDFKITR